MHACSYFFTVFHLDVLRRWIELKLKVAGDEARDVHAHTVTNGIPSGLVIWTKLTLF